MFNSEKMIVIYITCKLMSKSSSHSICEYFGYFLEGENVLNLYKPVKTGLLLVEVQQPHHM